MQQPQQQQQQQQHPQQPLSLNVNLSEVQATTPQPQTDQRTGHTDRKFGLSAIKRMVKIPAWNRNRRVKKMPKYVLTYFNFRARAELARLLFAVGGVEFEDERVTQVEDWIKAKERTPFGQLPILSVDGTQICQSLSIARFLAREFGLAGHTSMEQAKADMVVECVADMLEPIQPCYREKDPEKKRLMRQSYDDTLPAYMEKMEKLLCSNHSGDGYFVGDELTVADLAVMNSWHWIPGFGVFPPIHNFPKLKAHKDRVESHPRVATWLERRPQTPV